MGLQNQPFLAANRWQAQIAYQYGYATEFYVGDQRNDARAPFGTPPTRKVNLFNVDVMYGVSNRLSLDLTLPFLSGSSTSEQGTPQSHHSYPVSASGLGDISLQGEYWLTNPGIPSRWNGSVGLGVRAPTGSDNVQGTVYSQTAHADVQGPIDEAAQLGSGGWGILVFGQATARIAGPVSAYTSGYYLVSLQEHTDVINAGALRSVPDTYSARLGVGYFLRLLDGVVVSFGGRINGVTVSDLIGGKDLYWRRPGYEVFAEPGLTWTVGANSASFSYGARVYQKNWTALSTCPWPQAHRLQLRPLPSAAELRAAILESTPDPPASDRILAADASS